MSQVLDPAAAGREAFERRAWKKAYDLLLEADRTSGLEPEDLELLADAAFWSGNPVDGLSFLERAFRDQLKAGNRRRAAFIATTLSHHYKQVTQKAKAQGWLARAERLLDQEDEETVEHGWVAIQKALVALGQGDLDSVLALGLEAERIGQKFGDRNVEVIGIQRQGIALVEKGDAGEGLALLDLATTAAAAGELNPYETLVVYCNTIGTCRDRSDYGRASEWNDIADDFCSEFGVGGFPGVCRVNRAELLRHRGEFEEAEEQALSAVEELRSFSPRVAGEALYEIGEINLRLGRLAKASEAFEQAHDFGRDPEPGLSLLKLAEGKVDAAARSIRHALGDNTLLPLARARLLPAEVEIAIAAGDIDRARIAKDELVEIARLHKTEALEARASAARGVVSLAEGDIDEAFGCLRHAVRLWNEIGAPYEAARIRIALARGYRADGDEEAAARELRAARKVFEELGARLDAVQAAELLGVDTGRKVMRTFMFTDIVDSTRWAGSFGETKWKKLLRRHNDVLAELIARCDGEVVKTMGDGCFAAFESPGSAVEAAVAIQRAVDEALPFDVRIGLHAADATARDGDYEGRGVHAAARVGALAGAGEILASAAAVTDGIRFATSDPRPVSLKGFDEAAEVVSVEWRPA
jgi:class 3 adenylate cyclase